jgi:hypothetical protein
MTDERIVTLESKLQALRDQLTRTVFDQSELERIQQNARGNVRPTEFMRFHSLRFMIDKLQNLFKEGWSYELNQAATNTEFSTHIDLKKPQALLKSQWDDSDEKARAEYLTSLDDAKESLIREIAEATIELAQAKTEVKEAGRKKKEFERELAKVRNEFQVPREKETKETSVEVVEEVNNDA